MLNEIQKINSLAPLMPSYSVNPEANLDGTSLAGYFDASYAELVAAFGEPRESDGYKVSGEWTFESSTGDVFTVYDWKATNLYDSSGSSVEVFRRRDSFTWNVGARDKLAARTFIAMMGEFLEMRRANPENAAQTAAVLATLRGD